MIHSEDGHGLQIGADLTSFPDKIIEGSEPLVHYRSRALFKNSEECKLRKK